MNYFSFSAAVSSKRLYFSTQELSISVSSSSEIVFWEIWAGHLFKEQKNKVIIFLQ